MCGLPNLICILISLRRNVMAPQGGNVRYIAPLRTHYFHCVPYCGSYDMEGVLYTAPSRNQCSLESCDKLPITDDSVALS